MSDVLTVEEHRGAGVFDHTARIWLTRIPTNRCPLSGEYSLTDKGCYSFAPADAGHQMELIYDLVGPKVTVMDKHERRRA